MISICSLYDWGTLGAKCKKCVNGFGGQSVTGLCTNQGALDTKCKNTGTDGKQSRSVQAR